MNRVASIKVELGVEELDAKTPVGLLRQKINQPPAIIRRRLIVFSRIADIMKSEIRPPALSKAQVIILGKGSAPKYRNHHLSLSMKARRPKQHQTDQHPSSQNSRHGGANSMTSSLT